MYSFITSKEAIMRRLSIEMTPEQHQRLKAMAALHGKSIKEYVLERVLPPSPETSLSEAEALRELEMLLKPRIEAAERGETVSKSVEQIFDEVASETTRH
jgi:hypothetical protein